LDADSGHLAAAVRQRAENLFLAHRLRCAEAVFGTLNRGLGGGLEESLALRLASGFPEGLGGRGCLCGALSGGSLALGLFLGQARPGPLMRADGVRRAAGRLHDAFRERYHSTCCRVLTRGLEPGSKAHFQHCAAVTGAAAELTALVLLDMRPALAERVDWAYLEARDSRLGAGWRLLTGAWRGGQAAG
jgi:C_GCAxxG_C_C family probable redox protein